MAKKKMEALKPSLVRWLEIQRQQKILDEEKEALKKYIVLKMGVQEEITVDGITVRNTTYPTCRFDSSRLKLADEALFNRYLTAGTATRFTVT